MNKIILFLLLVILISCKKTKRPHTSLTAVSHADSLQSKPASDTIIFEKPTCYSYDDVIRKFRFSDDSIEIRLQYSCLTNSLVERVSQNAEGKLEKYFYCDYKIVINFNHPLISKKYSFTKALFADSLNNDWIQECVFGNSLIDGFDNKDTSVLISPFIGYPEGDNGVVANLKVSYNSGIKIINIVEPEFE